MYNDSDFDDVATEITEHAMAIGDPQMATTIEEWLTKLTSGDRGLDELNYLRLLQHMMAQRRVTRPFVSPPPEGPLSPLARYLKPPEGQPHDQCEDRSKNGGTDSVVDADGYRGNEEDDDYDVLSYGSTDTFRETTVTGTSVTTADRAGDDTDKDDEDRGGTAGGQDDEAAVAAAAAVGSQPWTKRDGHLAAAGETYENGGNRDAKRFDLLCDPCVDGTGPRGREILSGRPLDAAYKSLLGDCALPVFTEADKKNVGSELLRVLQNVNNDTTLQDFYYQVSQYTCDQGVTMIKMGESMVEDFRTFVSDVFESRTEHISDGLSKEQTTLNEKYTYLKDRALNRATVALDFLREAVPVFSWHKYHSDPEAYMKREILRRMPSASDDPNAAAGGSGAASAVDGGGAVGGDDDEDGAQQQSVAIKKLLYSLNWMRTEVARVDCEGLRLYEQRDRLTAGLVETNQKRTAAQCHATNDIDRHQTNLTLLRHKSNEQSKIIDRLVETIQIMQAKQPSSTSGSC